MSPSQHTSSVAGDDRRQRGEQPAEALGQRQERAQRLVGLGGVDVDRERHELAGEGELHHVGDGVAGLVLRLAGAGAEVRGDHHAVELEQRRRGGGLGDEHVERGTGDDAVADDVGQVLLVDDAAAGDVDDPQATAWPSAAGRG